MKNLILFLCIFSFSISMSGQEKVLSAAEDQMDRELFGNPYPFGHQSYFNSKRFNVSIDKQKYFEFKEWKPLKAIGKKGQKLEMDSANYLIEKRLILFVKDGKMLQLYPHAANMVIIEDKIYKAFPSVSKKEESILGFYEVLLAGDLELVKVSDLKEQTVSNNPMGISDGNEVEVVKSSKLYYINRKDKKIWLKRIPRKKSDVFGIFRRNKSQVSKYASKHKLSTRNEADLIQLFTFYNSKYPIVKE